MSKVARNALYLYIQSIIGAGAGYTFWLIISRLTNPEIVGLASATTAIAVVGSSFASLGVPIGVRRFLGKAVLETNSSISKMYLNAPLSTVV